MEDPVKSGQLHVMFLFYIPKGTYSHLLGQLYTEERGICRSIEVFGYTVQTDADPQGTRALSASKRVYENN